MNMDFEYETASKTLVFRVIFTEVFNTILNNIRNIGNNFEFKHIIYYF